MMFEDRNALLKIFASRGIYPDCFTPDTDYTKCTSMETKKCLTCCLNKDYEIYKGVKLKCHCISKEEL